MYTTASGLQPFVLYGHLAEVYICAYPIYVSLNILLFKFVVERLHMVDCILQLIFSIW